MEYKRYGDAVLLRLDPEEELFVQLEAVCAEERIHFAKVEGLGALRSFTAGVFDTETKRFCANEFQGRYEIVSLTGTVTTKDGAFYPHLHMSAADETGAVFGGHLSRAVVSATAELVLTVMEGKVERQFDEKIGLNLLEF